jgi:hypothetical protein
MPDSENKHVTNLPSVDIRALEQDVQNGLVTEDINPISPLPSSNLYLSATSEG